MRQTADALGPFTVLIALVVGVGVALGAARYSSLSMVTTVPLPGSGAAAPAQSQENTARTIDISAGDRAAGRIAFRSQCQECHTQGRQSFDIEARERLPLISARVREGGRDETDEMPGFSTAALPDDLLVHVLTYIATPAEPEERAPLPPRIRGVNAEILDATVRPGQPPTVRVRVKDDQGVAFAPGALASLAVTVGGPTTDYKWFVREDIRARAQVQPDGALQYVFAAPLPADASGSVAVAVESSLLYPAGTAGPNAVTEYAFNPVRYFALTDPVAVPHPSIVKIESCNECHGALALHGGGRRNTELCVICHNAVESDVVKRRLIAEPMPPEPILFSNLVHRIHTGEDVSKPFFVVGGGATNMRAIDLAAIEPFPKDRANCALCHEPGTFNITRGLEAKTGIKITVDNEVVRQMAPVTAACTGCHDSDRVVSHALAQIAPNGAETCATCHGVGRAFSPTAVHRIAAEKK